MGHCERRFGAGAFFISSREPPYYNGHVFLLCSSDKVYKKHTKIKIIEYYMYGDVGQRASRSGGGCLCANRNGKWNWKFHLKILNVQNHRVPYSTATWGIVEDASEPAPFLSVVASRNDKWTRIFALIQQRSLEKNHKTKSIKEP